MNKFKKLTVVEPINITKDGYKQLEKFADEVIFFDTLPNNDEEMAKRIDDSDAVLISYTSVLTANAMEKCPNLKYVGMCCSLYSEKSANVDIEYAKNNHITVKGVNDYGDDGVAEFAIYELCSVMHGFNGIMWENEPREIGGLNIGILGMGATGSIIAKAIKPFGANLFYYSRTRKPEKECENINYLPLNELLQKCEVVFCCLNKNVVLLNEKEFDLMKGKKLIINTSISPSHNIKAMKKWLLESDEHYLFGDCPLAIGNDDLMTFKNVRCDGKLSSGCTKQSYERLTSKVFDNIKSVL